MNPIPWLPGYAAASAIFWIAGLLALRSGRSRTGLGLYFGGSLVLLAYAGVL